MSEENNKGVDFGFDLSALNSMSEQFGDRFNPTSDPIDEPAPEPGADEIKQPAGQGVDGEPSDPSNSDTEDVSGTDPKEIDDPSSQNTDDTSSLLTPYAKMLVEEGLLELDIDNFDGTAEAIREAEQKKVLSEIERGINEYKETLDPRVKWLQDNVEAGVPLEDLLAIDKSHTSLEQISEDKLLEDSELQKEIAKQYYKETTRFSESRIDKEVERLDQLGELEDETKGFLSELKEINAQKATLLRQQAEQEQQARLKQQEEALKNFETKLKTTKEIIPDVPVSDTMKDRIFKTLTTVVDVDEFGQPMSKIAKARASDPEGFEMKLAYLFEVTNGFTDWKSIMSAGRRSAIKDFEVAASKTPLDGQSIPKRPTFTSEDSRSYLDAMKNMRF